MAQLENGMDDRSNAWCFTCSRWAEQDVYIVLPVNPSEFEVVNPLRGTQGETQRGKFMYVHRNPLSKSVIAPCNYTFTIPSGLVLPQFSEAYIREARGLVNEFANSMHALRNAQATDSVNTQLGGDPAEQRRRITDRKIDSYRASALKFEAKRPSRDTVVDYRTRSVAYRFHESAISNIPSLYVADVPIGIQNFYAFIMLLDEQKIFTDKHGNLRNNQVIVHFNSLELPAMTFYGWPDAGGLQFTESVDDYGQFDISFSLFVTAESPSYGYNKFNDMMTKYKAEINGNTTSLERLRSEVLKSPH